MEELATVIQSLDGNPRQEEVEDMLSELNADGNGSVDFADFLNVMSRKNKVIILTKYHRIRVRVSL